jgi:2-keto-4-pentenoate hydratase/2-oxohepta-3-ene-1,7-dioic acid hydratase in catechol pathway
MPSPSFHGDGEVRQDADSTVFFFDIPEVIATVSEFFTFSPGDVIASGTPLGPAGEAVEREEWGAKVPELALDHGDVVGVLRNEVV